MTAVLAPLEVRALESHGRSVIVRTSMLDSTEADWLRSMTPLGLRCICIGGVPDVFPGRPKVAPLDLVALDRPGEHEPDASVAAHGCEQLDPGLDDDMVELLQELVRSCGLTPLPASVYDDPAWTHTIGGRGPDCVVSTQELSVPFMADPGGRQGLVCGVATAPELRRRGMASDVLSAVIAGTECSSLVAFVEPDDSASHLLFARHEFVLTAVDAVFAYWG